MTVALRNIGEVVPVVLMSSICISRVLKVLRLEGNSLGYILVPRSLPFAIAPDIVDISVQALFVFVRTDSTIVSVAVLSKKSRISRIAFSLHHSPPSKTRLCIYPVFMYLVDT